MSESVMSLSYTFTLDDKSQEILSKVKNKSEFVRKALEAHALGLGLIEPPSSFDESGKFVVTPEIESAVKGNIEVARERELERVANEKRERLKVVLSPLLREREEAFAVNDLERVKVLSERINEVKKVG